MNKPIFTKEQYDLLVDFVNDRIEDLDKDVEMMLFLPNANFEEGFRKCSDVLDKLRAIRTQLDEYESILTSETFYRNEIYCESMRETIDEANEIISEYKEENRKLKEAIEIIKDKLYISISPCDDIEYTNTGYLIEESLGYDELTFEEYKLLKEVLEDE